MAKKQRPTKTKSVAARACGLCGKTGKLRRTECCGNRICDDYDEYRLFSFARNSCSRNHDRYTLCAIHHADQHPGDWKTCPACREHHGSTEMFVWAATNEFNFTKLENPPEFEPTRCAKCRRVIRLGFEGFSIKGGDHFCEDCTAFPA